MCKSKNINSTGQPTDSTDISEKKKERKEKNGMGGTGRGPNTTTPKHDERELHSDSSYLNSIYVRGGGLRTKYQDTLNTKNTIFNISSVVKYITCMCTKVYSSKVVTQ